jgi:hypothetical protein
MLMVLSCYLRCDIHFMGVVKRLVGFKTIRVDNTSCLDFEFNGAVKGKVEVEAVLVVGNGANGGDDELSIAGDVDSHVSEIGVLVEYTSILFAIDVSCDFEGGRTTKEGQ